MDVGSADTREYIQSLSAKMSTAFNSVSHLTQGKGKVNVDLYCTLSWTHL